MPLIRHAIVPPPYRQHRHIFATPKRYRCGVCHFFAVAAIRFALPPPPLCAAMSRRRQPDAAIDADASYYYAIITLAEATPPPALRCA